MPVERGPVGRTLEGVTDSKERASLKAQAIVAALQPLVPFEWTTTDGFTIRVTHVALENPMVRADVRAFAGKRELPLNGPFFFANPPLAVPDGTTVAVLDPLSGRTEQKWAYREDPVAATKAIIEDAALRGRR